MSKAPVAQLVKIVVPAGKATPSPPVGPALGARGVKAMDFCKEFNARTAHLTPSTPTPTQITINPDRTFSFTFRTPPVSHLLKAAASIDKGSGSPGTSKVGTVSLKHVYEIARIKCRDEALGVLGEEKVARGINLAGLSPAALNPEDKVVVRAVVVPGRLTTCVNAASDRHGRRIGQDNRDIANDTVAVRESVLEGLTPEAQEQGDAASGGLLEPEIDVIGLAAAGAFLDFVFTEAR